MNTLHEVIKHRVTGEVLYEYTSRLTIRQALEQAISRGANLRGANLRGANLYGANLDNADLCDTDLYDADLRGANLGNANLYGANLHGAFLYGANLYNGILCGANLRDADLRNANLRGADLCGALLRGANLYGAFLCGAFLRGADLYGANLYDADLRGANPGSHGRLIGRRPFFQCGPIGSRADYLTSFLTDKGITIQTGCFTGTIDEFRLRLANTHGDNDHAKEYETALLMIESHATVWGKV